MRSVCCVKDSGSNFAEQLRAVPNELLAKTIQLGKSWKLCLAWRYVAKPVISMYRSDQADYPTRARMRRHQPMIAAFGE